MLRLWNSMTASWAHTGQTAGGWWSSSMPVGSCAGSVLPTFPNVQAWLLSEAAGVLSMAYFEGVKVEKDTIRLE